MEPVADKARWCKAENLLTSIKINEKYLIRISNSEINVGKNIKESCKVLHFSSDLKIDEIFAILTRLRAKEYPNLFVFIIEYNNFESFVFNNEAKENEIVENLNDVLEGFSKNRPIVLQLSSSDGRTTKLYFKEEDLSQFVQVDQEYKDCFNFSSFQYFCMNAKFKNFEDGLVATLNSVENPSLLLRFLKVLSLSEEVFRSIVLNIAENGTKSDFIAALDAPFQDKGRCLSISAQNYLSSVFYEQESSNESENEQQILKHNTIESPSLAENHNGCENQLTIYEDDASNNKVMSVLLTAVQNSNKEICNYIVTFWTHLIQQLPFEHQVKISTAAFKLNHHDILCDLLDISDFPFPENFVIDEKTFNDDRLSKIVKSRIELSTAIEQENLIRIDEFIDEHTRLKVANSHDNKSAIKQAIDLKKFGIYCHLKSLGFKATEFSQLEDILNDEDLSKAKQFISQQRRKNINAALVNDQRSINSLCDRSLIHNRRIGKEREREYRQKIRNWYKDISKIKLGAEFLNVAASCPNLKIIFDFESDTVENSSLSGPFSLGSMYPFSKWIFVGAKLSDKEREQQIKGVLVHELCHYVMKLVYENQEKPYYKHMIEAAKNFEVIVKSINVWSYNDAECPDDGCNGIISSVFRHYEIEEYHLELIVRVLQILVEFDDDKDKIEILRKKYEKLFDFWDSIVAPELLKFKFDDRENVRKMNKDFELLPKITIENLQLEQSKDIKALTASKFVVVQTNVPKLLLFNLVNHLKSEHGNLFDTKSIFVDSQKAKNKEIQNNLLEISSKVHQLYLVIDCSKEILASLSKIDIGNYLQIIFVVSNAVNADKIKQDFKIQTNCLSIQINFKWNDLTIESQQFLLQTKINFQNNPEVSLADLLRFKNTKPTAIPISEVVQQHKQEDLSDIVNDELLNLLIEKQQINVNPHNVNELMYKKLYNNGKVFVLFDGFDEIAPHCAEFVSDLVASFKFNDGNMLCISTRSYFEVDLQTKLKVDDAYSLEQFTEQDGIDFIVAKWILIDQTSDIGVNSKEEFEKLIKSLPNYDKYYERAESIVRRVIQSDYRSVGMPQLFKIIADGFKVDDNSKISLKLFTIFQSFAKNLYKRWADEKGQIRKDASIESQQYELSFWKFHQFQAILSLFPKLAKLFFANYDRSEWIDEEIIACGLMSKKNNQYYFLHETFREFFATDFIAKELRKLKKLPEKHKFLKVLKNQSKGDKIINLVCKILTNRKFGIIRVFMNDIIEDPLIMDKIEPKMNKVMHNLFQYENFIEIFTKNLDNLAKIVFDLLKVENYEKVRNILCSSVKHIIINANERKMFLIFQKFIFEYLNQKDLEEIIENNDIYMLLFKSRFDIEILENFAGRLIKINREFSANQLKNMLYYDVIRSTIFDYFCSIKNANIKKAQVLLNIFRRQLTQDEILELIKICLRNQKSFLVICQWSEPVETFNSLWMKIKSNFEEEGFSKAFRMLLKQKNMYGENILQQSVVKNDIEFHNNLFALLSNTFENREELLNLILQKNHNNENFVNRLIKLKPNLDIIPLIFNHFRRIFCKNYYIEILGSIEIIGVETFTHSLTDLNQHFYKNLFSEIKEHCGSEQIKNNFSSLDSCKRNLLQSAAFFNNSVEYHKGLWSHFKQYFNDSKILELIRHTDYCGNNLLFNVVWGNNIEIAELTWLNIEIIMSRTEQIEYLKLIGYKNKNLIQIAFDNKHRPDMKIWVDNLLKKFNLNLEDSVNYFEQEWDYLKMH